MTTWFEGLDNSQDTRFFLGEALEGTALAKTCSVEKSFCLQKTCFFVCKIPFETTFDVILILILHDFAACIQCYGSTLRKVMAHAAPSTLKDDTTPPREGWERPPELMGYVTVEDFKHLGPERKRKSLGRSSGR